MPSLIQQHNIPEVIGALSGMEHPDYIDLFTVTTNGAADVSPEQAERVWRIRDDEAARAQRHSDGSFLPDRGSSSSTCSADGYDETSPHRIAGITEGSA